MELLVVAVGRSRDVPTDALFSDYARRCPWPLRLVEVQPRTPPPAGRRVEAEAELLAGAVPPGAARVALDENGETLTSAAFAARLGRWRDDGRRCVAFLIGGPDGHAARTLAGADLRLAFGRMTWPHRLVRPMLAEQLYRATMILAGHPYHHG